MHILLVNSEGYNAPGLLVLADALRNQHHTVTVVAPRERGDDCGTSLTRDSLIDVEKSDERSFIIDGTPADCVYLALNNLIDQPVDLVISGINSSPSLGDDLLHSGLVAAAMEARRMPIPSIAISLAKPKATHFETAAYIAVSLSNAIGHLQFKSLLSVLNVNVPDVPVADVRGLKATVLAEREATLSAHKKSGAGSKMQFMAGAKGGFREQYRAKPQDFDAVEQGYVSITPLSARLEDKAYVDDVQAWLDQI